MAYDDTTLEPLWRINVGAGINAPPMTFEAGGKQHVTVMTGLSRASMGAIMAVGVASANSILLVTFACEQQVAGHSAFEAAISAGHTRIRPVLMTAAAMIVGMIPMAIGGAGEEQNAALARAVIGGLLFATPTTLLIVPYLFAMLRKGNDGKSVHGVFEEHEIA
jgi:Cu/Ag efflux pump CusA